MRAVHQGRQPGSGPSNHGDRGRSNRNVRLNASAATLLGRAKRLATTARLARQSNELARHVEVRARPDMIEMGTRGYGFWSVPESLLGPESVCYLVGTGEDISFDLALIDRFGCTVHAFDPVPSAQEFVADAARYESRFVFHPLGIWSEDTTIRFHAPAVSGHVSHSATNIHDTKAAFETEVRSIQSVMRQLGHDHIDLLKISAEGAEFEILRGLEFDEIRPRILCVEFAQPAPSGEAKAAYDRLILGGYTLASALIRPWVCKMSFVR